MVFSLQSFALGQEGCTRETLTVKGTPVSASYCVTRTSRGPSGREVSVVVAQTFSSPKGSFSQNAPLQFVAGVDPARAIEDVNLSEVGIAGTLHLTLSYRGGLVHIDAAMLTPGAITIK